MGFQLSKHRKIIGWVISILVTALLLFSVTGKLIMPEMIENMNKWGLKDWRVIIACGEAISAILFLFPKTNIFGSFLLSSHMGGAIVIHMSHGEPFIFQSVVLVLIWASAFIRNPELLLKFNE